MTSTLSTHDLEPDLLSELARIAAPVPFAEKFKAACVAEASIAGILAAGEHGPVGYINPSKVRARLLDEPDYRPRQLSALWSSPWMTRTDVPVQISGAGSRGNLGKSAYWRRLVVSA